MKEIEKISNNFLESYIDNNRIKIDESLVSLRLMKEVDDFLDLNSISQREFSENIGCSEAYISQLMSGVKKFNASFINKFEKQYRLKIDFKIKPSKECDFISKISDSYIEIDIKLSVNIKVSNKPENMFTLINNQNGLYELDTNEYQTEL